MNVNIKGLDKAEVLAALYNATHQQGMGFLHDRGASSMTVEEARQELVKAPHMCFDYLHGRVMKVNISGDEFDSWGFDRDNYKGAAEEAIVPLREQLAIEA